MPAGIAVAGGLTVVDAAITGGADPRAAITALERKERPAVVLEDGLVQARQAKLLPL